MSREPFALSDMQFDRALGALLGSAASDALGADRRLFAPGEWTDNTAMAIAVAEIAIFANYLRASQRLDELLERWAWWRARPSGWDRRAPRCSRRPELMSTIGSSDVRGR